MGRSRNHILRSDTFPTTENSRNIASIFNNKIQLNGTETEVFLTVGRSNHEKVGIL